MSSDIQLFLGDIEGEVQRAGAEKSIAIDAVDFSAVNPTTIGQSKGAGTGKVELSTVNLTKSTDLASTRIFQSVCEGKRFDEAKIVMHKQHGGESLEYFVVEFKNCVVDSWHISDSDGADLPKESFTLAFEEINIRYSPQEDGGSPMEAGWNVITVSAP